MSRRFYPRNFKSRKAAIDGHWFNGPHNTKSRVDGIDAKFADCTVTPTGTLAAGATETEIVNGGKTVILTISGGQDAFSAEVVTNAAKFTALKAGFSNATIRAAFVSGNFVLSVGNTVLTVTLPATASYDISVTESLAWTVPASSFLNRSLPTAALALGDVTAV